MSGLDFYKLQRHSARWDKIIESSETYGSILQQMKDAYDDYMNALLDQQLMEASDKNVGRSCDDIICLHQPTQSTCTKQELSPLHQLPNEASTDKFDDKAEESETVQELEHDIKLLRVEIEEVMKRKTRLETILQEQHGTTDDETEEEVADELFKAEMAAFDRASLNEYQVGSMQAKIELKTRDMEALGLYRRRFFVPIVAFSRLEGCIKETEVDIQKLCKQNEFLDKNLDDLEEELDDVLIKTGVKEKSSRKLWKKVDTEKVIDIVNFA